ncbi:MAG: L-cystine import ATP-binding protein TcyN [Alphaproteobacteria bacterium ADurb.Bin438]|nr:MAG: L-cystine import ATP-binding protein TcyN [Alphaproteobacteria bacterium ADurb.Bin438]
MTNLKLELTNVSKAFGPKVVLDGFSMKVEKGKSMVIIGGSGTGKSVTLKCIQGLLVPESGSIKVDGEEVVGMKEKDLERVNSKAGMLFQGAALFDSMKVWENIAFGLIQGRKMNKNQAKEIAYDKLKKVGLTSDVGEMYPADLSGGMKKRVGLARAIATSPELIFFDEPTTGLDPIMADVINDLIVSCVKDLGATAVTITHDMVSARKIADEITMLYKGKNIWCGDVKDIDNSNNPYVEQFISGKSEGPIKVEI